MNLCWTTTNGFATSSTCGYSDCVSTRCESETDSGFHLSPIQHIAECDDCGMTHATCPIWNNYFWSSGAGMSVNSGASDNYYSSSSEVNSCCDYHICKNKVNAITHLLYASDVSDSVAMSNIGGTDCGVTRTEVVSKPVAVSNTEIRCLMSSNILKNECFECPASLEDNIDNKSISPFISAAENIEMTHLFELCSEDMKTDLSFNCLSASESGMRRDVSCG